MEPIRERESHEDEINLLEYVRILMRRRKLIILVTGAAFIFSIFYSLSLTKIYTASTSILPPQQEGGGFQMPSSVGALGGAFLGIRTPADLWVGILTSRAIKDAVIDRFDLVKAFKLRTKDQARGVLNGMVRASKSKEDIITITVDDRDPKRAAVLANAYVEELDKINKGIVMSTGRRMRVFVEGRMKEAKEELDKSENAIKEFQEKNKAVKLDEQSKAIIDAIGNVQGQLMAKEVELQTFLSYATPTNPQAEILQTQVQQLKERLRELEEGMGKAHGPSSKDIFIPTSKIPDLSIQYARLLRDSKVQETVNGLLAQQYEMARIQEAKDSPTVQVLDPAQVPERRSKPSRSKIVILYTFTAGVLSVFGAFLIEYIERMRSLQKASPGRERARHF